VQVAQTVLRLVQDDRARIAQLGRIAPSALKVHEALQRRPIATAAGLGEQTALTPATVNKALVSLERVGIVVELTSRQRGRVFAYQAYIEQIDSELEDAAPDKVARKRSARR
jgi:DNA-binding MarR family transcriptional regulator